ncbi:hypothetical protein IWX90DRAFT_163566 [Phyllosticta citrichinensis]|uniref:Uncharacterized protein n=1 Tax=Phyllosticta citrichinensis TaxID=1130410 RepID=A0ABR1Y0H5_9PEZI
MGLSSSHPNLTLQDCLGCLHQFFPLQATVYIVFMVLVFLTTTTVELPDRQVAQRIFSHRSHSLSLHWAFASPVSSNILVQDEESTIGRRRGRLRRHSDVGEIHSNYHHRLSFSTLLFPDATSITTNAAIIPPEHHLPVYRGDENRHHNDCA